MKSLIKIILCISALQLSNCKSTDDNPAEASQLDQSVDTCSNTAMAERREKVFNRTSNCVVNAVSFKLGDVLQTMALAAGEMHAFAKVIQEFNRHYGEISNLSVNTAKGVLCARVLFGEYTPVRTLAYVTQNMINESEGAELEPIETLGKDLALAGGLDIIAALHDAIEKPSVESVLKIATNGAITYADVAQLLTTCGPIFANVLSNEAPSIVAISGLSEKLGNLGVMAAIVDCSAAGLFNAIDVHTEYQCLKQDLEYVHKQNNAILSSEQLVCEDLKLLASVPTTIPIMKNVLNEKKDDGNPTESTTTRTSICDRTISAWGHCLASHPIDQRSDRWCEMLCKGESPEVQDNIHQVLTSSHIEKSSAVNLIKTYNESCIGDGNPEQLIKDQVKPCVDQCRDGTGGYTRSFPHIFRSRFNH